MHVNQIVVQTDILSVLENRAATWSKMVRIVALMVMFVKNLKTKVKQRKSDVIRVVRRLQHSHISDDCKHPILLPRKGKVSDLIIKHCIGKVVQGGHGFTLNEIEELDTAQLVPVLL